MYGDTVHSVTLIIATATLQIQGIGLHIWIGACTFGKIIALLEEVTMLKGAKLVSWLNHWLERAGLTYSDLAEVTSRGNSALFRALKGQHGLNEDVFVAILLHLRQVRALSERENYSMRCKKWRYLPQLFGRW
jgi:hypothetical protein